MDKSTIKTEIIRYLEANGPKFGGQIEDYIRQTGAKSSNISRRCRELVNSGILSRELVKLEGVPNKVVKYSVVEEEVICKDCWAHNINYKTHICDPLMRRLVGRHNVEQPIEQTEKLNL